ncbi:MAG: hypothetical protein M0037_09090 [Betaproteobacteria bacterium]|nr:hypothetical protein [Betaproteobacteria bacterium]
MIRPDRTLKFSGITKSQIHGPAKGFTLRRGEEDLPVECHRIVGVPVFGHDIEVPDQHHGLVAANLPFEETGEAGVSMRACSGTWGC